MARPRKGLGAPKKGQAPAKGTPTPIYPRGTATGPPKGIGGQVPIWPQGTPGAAPVGIPQPPDPAAEGANRQAIWNVGVGDAEANYQRGETAWGLGYRMDPTQGLVLDSSNPYSQAALLQDSYKRDIKGTNTSMAAAGQLYSGARLNAQGRNDRLYAEGSSALQDRARQTYHGIGFGQLTAYGQNMTGVDEARLTGLRTSVYGS